MKYVSNTLSTRPTIEGFYWAKCIGSLSGRVYETVVKVCSSEKGKPVDLVFWDGESINLNDDRLVAFAGPIERPKE